MTVKWPSGSANETSDLLAIYREGAEGTSKSMPAKANKSHDKMHASYKQLRESDAGKSGIMELMEDISPHVRCWAAAHSLEWQPERAKSVLTALCELRGPCSFDAEMVLREFDKGKLNFNY